MRAWEAEYLWERATPSYPAIRREPEPDSPMRTPFQRDRDRIVHSKAFRRLKHKTQVFIAPEGDHYRTRLTHTLEACGISRTVARALGLTRTSPRRSGSATTSVTRRSATSARRRSTRRCGSARADASSHNRHSLRVVDVLERDGRGLNLTETVRDGILNHTGPELPRDARGADRAPRRPRRVHQPRHRRRAAGRDHRPRRPPRGGDRAAGADGRRGSTRSCATSSSARARPATSSRARRSAAAMLRAARSSCSSASISAPRRAASTSACSGRCAGLFDHYMRASRRGPEGRGGRGRDPAGHRLHRRNDGPLLHRDASRTSRCPRSRGCERPFSPDTVERVKERADIVEIVSAHTDLRRAGRAVHGAVPVPRGAHAVVLGRPAREALPLLRLRGRAAT